MKTWFLRIWIVAACGLGLAVIAADNAPLAQLDAALKAAAAFEHGKDAGPLNTIEQVVFGAVKDEQQRSAVEQRLLQTLHAATTRDAKIFLCRQLYTIGTARSVPQLEGLLTDPDLSHMARRALGRMDIPEAAAALMRALEKTEGKTQMGIVATLGKIRHEPAVPALAKLLVSPDGAMAETAAIALGDIGGAGAVQALGAASAKASDRLATRIDDALMACADRFLADDLKEAASRIYESFYDPQHRKHIRIGALRGLLAAGVKDPATLLVEAIKSLDADLRASAISFVPVMKNLETATLTRLFAGLAPEAQELLLGALGQRGDALATPLVTEAAKSQHENVRTAAYSALASLGDATAVPVLAKAAVTASGNEQKVARASLVRLPGKDVNAALVEGLAAGEANTRVESIRALAGRHATATVKDLFSVARDANESVRREAINALGELALESDLPSLFDLVIDPKDSKDRSSLEEACGVALRRVADANRQATPILVALSKAPAPAKPALLRLLAVPATEAALSAVRKAREDSAAEVREAAVRTLCDWPTAQPAEDVLQIARAANDPTLKAVALRGYVRMAGLSKDPTAMYERAMDLAETDLDRKLVLGGLGTADTEAAMALVEKHVGNANLQTEAAMAMVQIAGRLRASNATRAKAALQQVVTQAQNERVRQQAQNLLNELEQYDGYILTWMVAGPYKEKGKDSRAIFNTVFPPEKSDASGIEWKPLNKGIGAWDINLESALGGHDHCVAYVRARVWSPADQAAQIELGSDDAVKAWINGQQVHANYVNRGFSPRQDIVKVGLRKEWNDLLLAIVEHEGGWGFCCRIRKPDGSALEQLKTEAK